MIDNVLRHIIKGMHTCLGRCCMYTYLNFGSVDVLMCRNVRLQLGLETYKIMQ